MILDLEDRPVQYITKGERYKVPTVHGVPIVLPSHVDEGNDGRTSKHWHTDRRWGDISLPAEKVRDETRKYLGMIHGDSLKTDTLRDDGQEVVYEEREALENIIWPSGGVFSSLVWLYYHLGDQPAVDGKFCVHHRTQLQECADGGLICPAHGLRYKEDGSPRFKGPFYLVAHSQKASWDCRAEVRFDEPIVIEVPKSNAYGEKKFNHPFSLQDSNREIIMVCEGGGEEIHNELMSVTVKAWPSSGYCPAMVD